MPRRSPRARALGRRARRRGGHRGRRGRRPRRAAPASRRARPRGRRGRRHPRPARGHRARRPATSRRARVYRSQLPGHASRRSAALSSGGSSRCRWWGARTSSPATSRPAVGPVSTASCPAACGRCGSWSPTRCDRGPGAAVDVLATYDPGGAGERDDGTGSWPPASRSLGTRPAERERCRTEPAPRA